MVIIRHEASKHTEKQMKEKPKLKKSPVVRRKAYRRATAYSLSARTKKEAISDCARLTLLKIQTEAMFIKQRTAVNEMHDGGAIPLSFIQHNMDRKGSSNFLPEKRN